MRTFTDERGDVWTIGITFAAMRRVKAMTGHDMGEPTAGNPPLFGMLADNLLTLVDVLVAVCQPEMQARKIDREAFEDRLTAAVIDAAYDALMEDWVDFFQSRGLQHQRDQMRAGIAMLKTLTRSSGSAVNSAASSG